MRFVRLVAFVDEYDSKPGLILKGQPNFDGLSASREGGLVAHDILEHQNGPYNIGAVWDELEALGALYQVRGRHGDLLNKQRSYHSVAVNVASDVTRMFREWYYDPEPGPGSPMAGTQSSSYDDAFREILQIAARDIPGEMYSGDDNSEAVAAIPVYLGLAMRRMRIGFRKAQRRFGTGYEGAQAFRLIRDTVTRSMPMVEVEGQEFMLCYDAHSARMQEIL
jgi:hypothetical protein